MDKLNSTMKKMDISMAKIQQSVRGLGQKHSVYPWNNHDFDYAKIVDRRYNPAAMGITDEPCPGPLINDVFNLENYPKALIKDPLPTTGDIAGVSDVDPSNSDLIKVKQGYKQYGEPYPNFLLEYPEYANKLSGDYASSYFLKTGTCRVRSITSKSECKSRGFTWVFNPVTPPTGSSDFFKGQPSTSSDSEGGRSSGNCFKPRYSFVNNKAGGPIGIFKGLTPTVGKEVLGLNPIALFNIATTGTSSSDDFTQLPCREGFQVLPPGKVIRTGPQISYILIVGIIIAMVIGYLSR